MKKSPYPEHGLQRLRWLNGWRTGNTERIEGEQAAQNAAQTARAPEPEARVTVFDESGAVEDAGGRIWLSRCWLDGCRIHCLRG